MTVPVVIVHGSEGICPDVDQEYLGVVLEQAQQYNRRVILLGDTANRHWGVEHYDYTDFCGEADRFLEKEYIKYSFYEDSYDQFCVSFYFILKEFMQAHNLDVIANIDSDVMVYCNMTAEKQRLPADYLLACCIPQRQSPFRWCASTHTSFITLQGICELCDFIHRTYTTLAGREKLKSKYEWHAEHSPHGGVCDMTLAWLFLQEVEARRIVNLTPRLTLPKEGAFSHNLSGGECGLPDEYKLEGRHKEIKWIDGQPHCWNLRLGAWVRFKTLHFQGGAKYLIASSFREARQAC